MRKSISCAIATCIDSCFVQYCEVEVRKEPLAYANLLAIVAVKWLDEEYFIIGNMTQESFQNLLSLLLLRRAQ